jgi:hypothetical protein
MANQHHGPLTFWQHWLASCLPQQEEAHDDLSHQILRLAQGKEAPWRSFPPNNQACPSTFS